MTDKLTISPVYPGNTVYFEETGEERRIDGFCKRCQASDERIMDDDFGVVSPRGMAHVGVDYGMTLCGIDSTGDKWWWQL